MDAASFNLLALNFFIGLMKGRRLMLPYCRKIQELGYKLVAIEVDVFTKTNERATPEAIAVSEPKEHTLLFESTAHEDPRTKMSQVRKYATVTSKSLVELTGIPAKASKSHGTWLVVPRDYESYRNSFSSLAPAGALILSEFHFGHGQYEMKFRDGSVADSDLTSLLKDGIRVRRMHHGYVLLPLHDLSHEALRKPVCQQIIAFVMNQRTQFTTQELAAMTYGPTWDLLAAKKRNAVIKKIRSVLRGIAAIDPTRDWFSKHLELDTWVVAAPDARTLDHFPDVLKKYAGMPVPAEVQQMLF